MKLPLEIGSFCRGHLVDFRGSSQQKKGGMIVEGLGNLGSWRLFIKVS